MCQIINAIIKQQYTGWRSKDVQVTVQRAPDFSVICHSEPCINCSCLQMSCITIDVQIRSWNRFCDPMKKKNWCDVAERYNRSWLLTFLKPSWKMPSIFCEFWCCNKKLFANKPISFFSYNTGKNVNKKNDTPTTKVNKRILLLVQSLNFLIFELFIL